MTYPRRRGRAVLRDVDVVDRLLNVGEDNVHVRVVSLGLAGVDDLRAGFSAASADDGTGDGPQRRQHIAAP